MKILHIINSLNTGGAEKLIIDTLPLYKENGLKVDLLLLNGKKTPFFEELEKYNITIHDLGFDSVYNPKLIFNIIPFLKNYSILHVHLFPAFYWVAFAKLFSRTKPYLVFTEHCTSNNRLENKIFKLIDKWVYYSYSKIVCISSEVLEIIKNHTKFKENKLEKIENGVNLENIKNALPVLKEKIDISLSKNDKLLMQVSGFRQQKDQKTLIKSMLLLPEEVKLVLVGDGVLKKECKELTKELKLAHRVLFLGIRADVYQLLKTVDIVILSTNFEGLSLSSIEGMASGKPFVASKVPGLINIVNGTGVLFEKGNANDLAQKIEKLLKDENYYNKVAKKCQEKSEQYDILTMVEKHINLYKSLS